MDSTFIIKHKTNHNLKHVDSPYPWVHSGWKILYRVLDAPWGLTIFGKTPDSTLWTNKLWEFPKDRTPIVLKDCTRAVNTTEVWQSYWWGPHKCTYRLDDGVCIEKKTTSDPTPVVPRGFDPVHTRAHRRLFNDMPKSKKPKKKDPFKVPAAWKWLAEDIKNLKET